jgi:hypothetical protein
MSAGTPATRRLHHRSSRVADDQGVSGHFTDLIGSTSSDDTNTSTIAQTNRIT